MALQDTAIPVRHKLAGLWTSTMFCYVYGDYFGLYIPGKLAEMGQGLIGPLGAASETVLLGVATMMAIPALMITLSLALAPALCRWLNVALGLAYSAILALTMPGAPPFYIWLGIIEIALTLAVVIVAWSWPQEPKAD